MICGGHQALACFIKLCLLKQLQVFLVSPPAGDAQCLANTCHDHTAEHPIFFSFCPQVPSWQSRLQSSSSPTNSITQEQGLRIPVVIQSSATTILVRMQKKSTQTNLSPSAKLSSSCHSQKPPAYFLSAKVLLTGRGFGEVSLFSSV